MEDLHSELTFPWHGVHPYLASSSDALWCIRDTDQQCQVNLRPSLCSSVVPLVNHEEIHHLQFWVNHALYSAVCKISTWLQVSASHSPPCEGCELFPGGMGKMIFQIIFIYVVLIFNWPCFLANPKTSVFDKRTKQLWGNVCSPFHIYIHTCENIVSTSTALSFTEWFLLLRWKVSELLWKVPEKYYWETPASVEQLQQWGNIYSPCVDEKHLNIFLYAIFIFPFPQTNHKTCRNFTSTDGQVSIRDFLKVLQGCVDSKLRRLCPHRQNCSHPVHQL